MEANNIPSAPEQQLAIMDDTTTPYDYIPERGDQQKSSTEEELQYTKQTSIPIPVSYNPRQQQQQFIAYEPTIVPLQSIGTGFQNDFIASSEPTLPNQIEIPYQNGEFLYESAQLQTLGCSKQHLQETFSHASKIVYRNYIAPATFIIGLHSIFQVFSTTFFITLLALPFLSAIWWRYGFVLGVAVAIVATIGYCLFSAAVLVFSYFLLRLIRVRNETLMHNYLNQQVSSYYAQYGISMAFFYALSEIYSGRGWIYVYKPRILVSIPVVA